MTAAIRKKRTALKRTKTPKKLTKGEHQALLIDKLIEQLRHLRHYELRVETADVIEKDSVTLDLRFHEVQVAETYAELMRGSK